MKILKSLLIVGCLLLTVSAASGQTSQAITVKGSNGLSRDTMRNSVTEYLTTSAMTATGTHGRYDFQLNVFNDSATTSVTAILQGSNDGTNWSRVFNVPGADGINCDSLTFTGTKTFIARIQPGINKIYSGTGLSYNTTAGRRVYLRWMLIHGNGGRSSYSGSIVTSE